MNKKNSILTDFNCVFKLENYKKLTVIYKELKKTTKTYTKQVI